MENILRNNFGFDNFKSEAQKEAIETIIKGEHTNYIINMKSQGGKSLCYQLPGLMKGQGITIIFSPSSILIDDQKNYLQSLGIRAEKIDGEVENSDRDTIRDEINQQNSNIRFLFVTAEVADKNSIMKDFLKNMISEGSHINYIVVDEAHKVVDSADFRESFELLADFRSKNENVPWICLTTVNKNFELEIARKLNMNNPKILASSSVMENIFYDVVLNEQLDDKKVERFMYDLRDKQGKIPSGIIFCNYVRDIKSNVDYFKHKSEIPIDARGYHREITNSRNNFEDWTNGVFPVLVTTGKTLGFGIHHHVPAIRFVIHLSRPENLRSFYHESSLAGNDGNLGYSIVYDYLETQFPNVNYEDFRGLAYAPCKRQYLTAYFEIEKCQNKCCNCNCREGMDFDE